MVASTTSEWAPTVLRGAGVLTLLAYGLPLTLAPLRWARLLGWRIPADTDLVVYLGRCLGAILCVLAAVAWIAADDPAAAPALYTILVGSAGAMIVVHVVGAITGRQPRAETIEILLWVGLVAVGLVTWPGG